MMAFWLMLSTCKPEDSAIVGQDVMLEGPAFVELAQYPVKALALQDRIPDFSKVGYAHGDEPLPDYPVRETLSPQSSTDMTASIQAALDRVAANHPEGGARRYGFVVESSDLCLFRNRCTYASFRTARQRKRNINKTKDKR